MRDALSTKIAYQNEYFAVREDTFRHPYDGAVGNYAYVEKSSAVVVIALADDSIYFVNQYRYAVDAESLELPIGKTEDAEPALEGAKRELKEETGLSASSWRLLGTLWEVPGWSSSSAYVYLAKGLTQSTQEVEESERDMTVSAVPLKDVKRLITDGQIHDCLTVGSIALLLMSAPDEGEF